MNYLSVNPLASNGHLRDELSVLNTIFFFSLLKLKQGNRILLISVSAAVLGSTQEHL